MGALRNPTAGPFPRWQRLPWFRSLKAMADSPRGDLLLLDNDSKIVELLSWFLDNQGFTVRVAASFAEARERLAERQPALLISDVDLGIESAVTELPKLSAEGILPPTLVVSGFLDETVRQALFSVPEVLDSLPKPFEFPDLEARVVACLSGGGRGEAVPALEPAVEADVVLEPAAAPTAAPTAGPTAGPEPAALPVTSPPSGAVADPVADDGDDDWIEISPGG